MAAFLGDLCISAARMRPPLLEPEVGYTQQQRISVRRYFAFPRSVFMSSQDSITRWIHEVREGVVGTPQDELVRRFLHRLTELARRRIGGLRGIEDEHDVALSAMKSFLMRVPQGGFPQLEDRESLWSLLAAITVNKVMALKRRQLAAKRDVRRELGIEEIVESGGGDQLVESVIGEGNRLLEGLADESLRDVARLRLEGYSNMEIADRVDRSVKTVERRLAMIREYLRDQLQ